TDVLLPSHDGAAPLLRLRAADVRTPTGTADEQTRDAPSRALRQRTVDGSRALRGVAGVRVGWRGRDRRGGHLERGECVQAAGVEARPPDVGDHGVDTRCDVPRPLRADGTPARRA